jgi:hypothetical protein
MPWSNYARDTFHVQGFSRMTSFTTEPIGGPGLGVWIPQFSLNSVFNFNPSPDWRRLAFAVLRRAEGAVADFDEACAAMTTFLSVPLEDRALTPYFLALRRFEGAIAQLWQAVAFVQKTTKATGKVFTRGDGSVYERVNTIYNLGRHADLTDLAPENIHPAWMESDGIHVEGAVLSFDELRALIVELAAVAATIATGRLPGAPSAPPPT